MTSVTIIISGHDQFLFKAKNALIFCAKAYDIVAYSQLMDYEQGHLVIIIIYFCTFGTAHIP